MDPNLFHLDWERVFEALATIIVLSFVVERALAPVFESYPFIVYVDKPGAKEVIALAVAIGGCIMWEFDVISIILLSEHTSRLGEVVTGAVIAGGSKASIKLFHDVLNVKSTSYERRHDVVAAAAAADAEAVLQKAKLDNLLVTDGRAETKLKKSKQIAMSAAAQSGSRCSSEAVDKVNRALFELQDMSNRGQP